MAPSHVDEPQISAEEMEQIEDFFAQLEAADVQSDTVAIHGSRISAGRG